MSSLKDALLKAGLKTKKIENERKHKYKFNRTESRINYNMNTIICYLTNY